MSHNAPLPAPAWRRIAALVYDILILLAISFVYGAIVTSISVQQGNAPSNYQPMFQSPLFLLGWLTCLLCFYCWFWHKSGQTLGMRTWRLKLVAKDSVETTPSWPQCFSRALIAPPLILFMGLGFWYQWLDKNNDCLQDKFSRTRVLLLPKGA